MRKINHTENFYYWLKSGYFAGGRGGLLILFTVMLFFCSFFAGFLFQKLFRISRPTYKNNLLDSFCCYEILTKLMEKEILLDTFQVETVPFS